jgi:ribonuclease J
VGESSDLIEATKERVRDVLARHAGDHATENGQYLSRQLRNATQQFLRRETGRRPMVLPVVLEY